METNGIIHNHSANTVEYKKDRSVVATFSHDLSVGDYVNMEYSRACFHREKLGRIWRVARVDEKRPLKHAKGLPGTFTKCTLELDEA